MKEKYGFVYIWYDKKRKMFYIGCHWGKEDDGYVCSSNRMRDAYRRRPDDFRRRILKTNIKDRTTLLDEEYNWLKLIKKEELSFKYYNAINMRFGHWSETQDKSGNKHPMFGKKHTDEAKEKIRKSRVGKEPWNKGKTGVYSNEVLCKMGEKNIGNTYNLGRKHTDDSKLKMSKSRVGKDTWNKGKTGIYSEETLKKMSENSKGQIAWNKGKKCPNLTGDRNGAKKLKGMSWKKCPESGKRIWVSAND
jgi:hypothetical protein